MVESEGFFFTPPKRTSDNELIWSLGPRSMSNLHIHTPTETISTEGRVHTRPRITDYSATLTV